MGEAAALERTMEFNLTGIENATFSKDRAKVTIKLRSEQGTIALEMPADHLDSLITNLEKIAYDASLLVPAKGPLPGEQAEFELRRSTITRSATASPMACRVYSWVARPEGYSAGSHSTTMISSLAGRR